MALEYKNKIIKFVSVVQLLLGLLDSFTLYSFAAAGKTFPLEPVSWNVLLNLYQETSELSFCPSEHILYAFHSSLTG